MGAGWRGAGNVKQVITQAKDADSVFGAFMAGAMAYLASLSLDGWLSLTTTLLGIAGGLLGCILLILRIRLTKKELDG